jgi:hypothetical protein
VTRRNASCAIGPLSMTTQEFLAEAHAEARDGQLRMTGGELRARTHPAARHIVNGLRSFL